MDKEMMKGSIDILVLSIISHYDTYGYEIIQKLKEQSNDVYHMSQGTLYPALKRMEQKNLIESYWRESETGQKRKFYCITVTGKQELEKKLNYWGQITALIQTCRKGEFA
ncbi:PadR family transcriptional regulator [Bacillus cereus group sp. BfR-BA-01380]|uniref:PadR family transcriptional regulator n=1 Tax=Bacillus cereus group sp. BfR-BA-01380 TaxID=2920324 RepID=UPI001F5949EF|nr:helix-turn-helix transcriptional regulator [Bacillus cereus group sp. BfR-BA-01380]